MSTTTSEIDEYVAAVHAALADLPDAEREDLLDDLPQHLADVQADRPGTLTDLIGSPEDYAAELRATAGLGVSPLSRAWRSTLLDRLTRADNRLGAMLGYARFADLVRALVPAWWLVRAWLLVEVGTGATQRSGTDALIPAVSGNRVFGVLLLLLAVVGSVWLGRRGFAREWQRVIALLIGVVLFCYGVALLRHSTQTFTVYVDSSTNGDGGTSDVQNIYPVGPDGTVLKNVRLYDQDGNPVQLDNPICPPEVSTTFTVGDSNLGDPGAPSAPTYPLACTANRGPFPAGQAPVLDAPSAAPSSAAAPTSPTPAPAASKSPTPAASKSPAAPAPTAAPTH